jgi:hypothetical protein
VILKPWINWVFWNQNTMHKSQHLWPFMSTWITWGTLKTQVLNVVKPEILAICMLWDETHLQKQDHTLSGKPSGLIYHLGSHCVPCWGQALPVLKLFWEARDNYLGNFPSPAFENQRTKWFFTNSVSVIKYSLF